MTFKFGPKSIENMTGVHPQLIHAAHFALQKSSVDFGFFEGVRTVEREEQLIAEGKSKLKNPQDCMHCVQKDGLGHAMDLVPYLPVKNEAKSLEAGEDVFEMQSSWDWPACFEIAKLVQQWAFINNVTIRWGGVWDIPLNKLSINLEREVEAYKARHKGADFLDGVHFELPFVNNTSDDAKDKAMIA